MKRRIVRAALVAAVAGLLALAGTAPLGMPGGWSATSTTTTWTGK